MNDAASHSSDDTRAPRNWWIWGTVALALIVVVAMLTGEGPTPRGTGPIDGGKEIGIDLFDSATATLDRLEEFDTEPALRLVIDRLNQWIELDKPKGDWQIDPLIETLPDEPAGLKNLASEKSAAALRFTADDAQHLLETNWLRNIALQARGDAADELTRATNLFDWTIRNIQLDDEPSRLTHKIRGDDEASQQDEKGVPLTLRDVLLFGHGDYLHRAWVFMALARQQNLPVVLLAVRDSQRPDVLRPWATALVHRDNLYLFDTRLGLPIPGPDGKAVATLAEVAADDSLLRALDLPDYRYRMRAEQLKDVVAFIEASPAYLSRRMELVESRLAGERAVVLTVDASSLATSLKDQSQIGETRIWPRPYEIALERQNLAPADMQPLRTAMVPFAIRFPTPRPGVDSRTGIGSDEHPLFMSQGQEEVAKAEQSQLRYQACSLWAGRVMHFKGKFTSDANLDGASTHYLEVRVHEDKMDEVIDQFTAQARLADENVQKMLRQNLTIALPDARDYASYWLGLVAYERGNYPVAIDYFKKRTLEESPDSYWTYGATYNLARTFEAQAKDPAATPEQATAWIEQAIKLLENDDSPQERGNKVRARRLKSQLPTAKADP